MISGAPSQLCAAGASPATPANLSKKMWNRCPENRAGEHCGFCSAAARTIGQAEVYLIVDGVRTEPVPPRTVAPMHFGLRPSNRVRRDPAYRLRGVSSFRLRKIDQLRNPSRSIRVI